MRGLNFLRKTADDRKAEKKEEELEEMMGGMEETDLALLQPYVKWNADADRYVVNRTELIEVNGKIWERYSLIEEMSVVEGRKIASNDDASEKDNRAELIAFIKSRK